jgi:F0F1-type ATP synthase assembly protein I
MIEFNLFTWWALAITFGIIFLIVVSIYLFWDSRKKRREDKQNKIGAYKIVKEFIFVWILIGLLILYITSINLVSAILFAVGNIIVEVILSIYLFRNKGQKSEQTQTITTE